MRQDFVQLIDEHDRRVKVLIYQVVVVMLIIAACSYYTELLKPERLIDGVPSIIQLVGEGLPPDFSEYKVWIKPLFDTLAMSIAGTALAVFFSVPLGVLAARNTTPNGFVFQVTRSILNMLRAIPELIMGIIFVAAVGFGALPGVLALGLHSIGMVGKFISESIEHVAEEPIEAVRSTGASEFQIISHGVIPQVLPQIADVTIYRWEFNFRASTVMGMVGAGGIGTELMGALRLMRYQEVTALLIVILLMVTIVDGISILLRKKFK